jgi:hypothetical protein
MLKHLSTNGLSVFWIPVVATFKHLSINRLSERCLEPDFRISKKVYPILAPIKHLIMTVERLNYFVLVENKRRNINL